MRELVIKNLRLVVDARDTDAIYEAHRVVAHANAALSKNDGSPILLFETTVNAEYVDDGLDNKGGA